MVSCLGSLVQSCCGKEGHCRQVSLVCVGSTGSVPATLVLPPLGAGVCASPSTLLRLQAALQGAGPAWRGLPRPKTLRFRFSVIPQKHGLGWACVLCLPWSEQLRQPGAWRAHSPGCRALYPLRGPSLSFHALWSGAPCVSSGKLISGCDPPGRCWPSRISGSVCLEAGGLFAVW